MRESVFGIARNCHFYNVRCDIVHEQSSVVVLSALQQLSFLPPSFDSVGQVGAEFEQDYGHDCKKEALLKAEDVLILSGVDYDLIELIGTENAQFVTYGSQMKTHFHALHQMLIQ